MTNTIECTLVGAVDRYLLEDRVRLSSSRNESEERKELHGADDLGKGDGRRYAILGLDGIGYCCLYSIDDGWQSVGMQERVRRCIKNAFSRPRIAAEVARRLGQPSADQSVVDKV